MCGIIGYSPCDPDEPAVVRAAFDNLFKQSTIRGLHAYGLAQYDEHFDVTDVHRSLTPELVPTLFDPTRAAIAHCRYCLSGDWQVLNNNQPLVVGNFALAFNGVISMGTKEEFEAAFQVACESDNDGEVFIQRVLAGQTEIDFIRSLTGSFAGVWLKHGKLYAGRNARRPLWRCEAFGALWYASTHDIFARAGFEGMVPVEAVC